MVADLFKHSSLYFVGSLISKVFTTLAWIVLARGLTPEKYGQFTLFFTIVQTTTFAADFGLNQYYLKKAEGENKKVLFNKIIKVRTLTLFISILVVGLFLFTAKIFNPLINLILLATLIPMSYLSIIEGYFLEKKKSLRISFKLASIGLIFLLGYIFLRNNLTFDLTVIILFISILFTLGFFFPWREIDLNNILTTPQSITILKHSSPYAMLILTSFLYNRGDSFIIAFFLGNAALGIYGLAYRFLESLSLFPTSLVQNLFPVSAKKAGITKSQINKIFAVMFLLGLFFAVGVFLLTPFLIGDLFPRDYLGAIPILRIFSLVILLFFINAPLATVVQSSKLVKLFLPYGIANTLLNIFLNILFIPVFGIIAAAWVMVVSEITGLIINLFFVKKLYS